MIRSRALHRSLAGLALVGTLSPLVGCARYEPVVSPLPADGSAVVRVTLTEEGRLAVANALEPDLVSMVGHAQPARGDSLRMVVGRTWHSSGFDMARRGDTVLLAPSHIATASRRHVSILRTLALGAGTGALAVLLQSLVVQSGSGGGTGGGGEGGGTPP